MQAAVLAFSSLRHDSVILKLCGQKHFPVGQSVSPMFCWLISPRYPHHTFVVKDIAASLPHYYPRGWCLNPGNFCKRAPMAPMAQNPIRIWGPKTPKKRSIHVNPGLRNPKRLFNWGVPLKYQMKWLLEEYPLIKTIMFPTAEELEALARAHLQSLEVGLDVGSRIYLWVTTNLWGLYIHIHIYI